MNGIIKIIFWNIYMYYSYIYISCVEKTLCIYKSNPYFPHPLYKQSRGKKSIKKHKKNKEKIKREERKIKPISSLSNSCKPPQIAAALLLALLTTQLLPCTLLHKLSCCRQIAFETITTPFSQCNTNQHPLSSNHYLFSKLNILVSTYSPFIFIFILFKSKNRV